MKKNKNLLWADISSFAKAEDSPGYLLWVVSTQWRRLLEESLATLELTHTQFVLLATIGFLTKRGSHVAQIALSEHAKLHNAMTSQVLKTLEKKELITRTHKQNDDRAKYTVLTQQGMDLLAKAVPLVESLDTSFFSKLSPKEQTLYQSLMAKLACP